MMAWTVPTDNPLIVGRNGGPWMAFAYGQPGWASRSYRLWVFDYRLTDLY